MRKIDPLQEVKAILKELEFSLEQRKGIWKQLQTDNPNFPQLSEMHWKEVENNSWILGTSEIGEINALETWTPEYPNLSDTAKSYASHCVSHWRKWLEITDAYYEPFKAFE